MLQDVHNTCPPLNSQVPPPDDSLPQFDGHTSADSDVVGSGHVGSGGVTEEYTVGSTVGFGIGLAEGDSVGRSVGPCIDPVSDGASVDGVHSVKPGGQSVVPGAK